MYNLLNNLARRVKYPKQPNFLNRIVNQLYHNPDEVMIREKDVDYVVMEGCKFHPSMHLNTLVRMEGNPWFDRVRKEDIVLDIGACIGSVAIPLATKTKKVYAVEPLLHEELQRNIDLNGLTNIEVVPWGVGRGRMRIEYGSESKVVSLVSFATLLKGVDEGRVDFLKVDCEGCEWGINMEEVLGIREVRIEFHRRRGKGDGKKVVEWVDFLGRRGYEVEVEVDVHKEASILFDGIDYLRASWK